MRVLTIDIGNHKIKSEIWQDKGDVHRVEIMDKYGEELSELIRNLDIEGIIVSSVKKDSGRVLEFWRDKLDCKVISFDKKEIERYSSHNIYKGNLGADRMAAFLGAQSLSPSDPMLIIDAGTAITTDVADSRGNFCGGNISIGLYSRLHHLADSTSLLPKVEIDRTVKSFGDDTVSAIRSGAVMGITGELLYAIERGKKEYDIKKVFLTGGDAEILLPYIENKVDDLTWDPFLVGRGLYQHYRRFYS